ncbi:TRAP-type C4-dicarboxylate transport system, substrate-binding protein [Marinobacter daqiaonensis]|uniref:TRAP-type C4-dicarboxylate transport system, substrate-binding protein n=1 Tax=Marinobacter daqiaonensis TaxID=650891 RepID=A0A1I6IPB2_9GAMM|nr:C4-dicarboxylate TRAP transporter substrate-binding protein [Marinobacter daqiaonensis]SFR68564.1 TRAP-type C4-dicarboxylate transport system, substrate-binding protein [Marinobacter daqiaonensis]
MTLRNAIKQFAAPLLLGGLVVASGANATSISHATGYPPNSIGADSAETYARALEEISGGELTAKVYAGSLLSFKETSPGIRDGMADSGFVLLSYYPSEFPVTNLVGELSMLTELVDVAPSHAGLAYVGAMSEFIMNDCPECIEEFAAQNQVFTGGSASTAYFLLCNQPVTTVEQAKGKRFRTAGAHWARWTEEVGATPVSLSIAETYEALNQGVLDCTISSPTELDIFKLKEVTSDITQGVPGGVYGATAVNNLSRDVWRGLSEEERRYILKATAVLGADISWKYQVSASKEMENASESQITVHQPSDELVEMTEAFIRNDLDTIVERYEEKYGVTGADLVIDSFRSLLTKWSGLVEGIDNADDLADLYWEEIYSKVDVSAYGM